jgi:hypoxanthine-DNA glycosylase
MARHKATDPSPGFAPVARSDARILILGSLPGQKSLEAAQYYAHAQNAFWRIMMDVFGITGDYEARCSQLMSHRVAVWDVLASSVRPGSLDANIELPSAQANDFESFFATHREVTTVCFNGRKSRQLYERLVVPVLACNVHTHKDLPSTSPAFAAMRYGQKLKLWRGILDASPIRNGVRS